MIDGVFEEGVAGCGGHKCVVDAGWETGWRDPVHGGEKVERDFACDIKVDVYPSELVEDEVSNHVRALYFWQT